MDFAIFLTYLRAALALEPGRDAPFNPSACRFQKLRGDLCNRRLGTDLVLLHPAKIVCTINF